MDDPNNQVASIQVQEIPTVREYKYLGVLLRVIQKATRKSTTINGKRNAALMKHRALWGYNRYEVL